MRNLKDALALRFGDYAHDISPPAEAGGAWARLANRGVCRRFKPERVPAQTVDTLCALALSSPTKSDLQQRDILIVEDPAKRARLNELLTDQDWLPACPHFVIFLGNNRRHRQFFEWRDYPFINDHLDAFFNTAVDAGIALSAFVIAADAAGIGTCPVSVIRNYAQEVSDMFGLPDHVYPVAGLGFGYPAGETYVSARLPLSATVHRDRFEESSIRADVDSYDRRRDSIFPYRRQREPDRFGKAEFYGWSEDKARQYSKPERQDFGAFIRRKGFNLD
ncbi:MAG: nitroreductase family protein [Beijerinckiaceae bacterium]